MLLIDVLQDNFTYDWILVIVLEELQMRIGVCDSSLIIFYMPSQDDADAHIDDVVS